MFQKFILFISLFYATILFSQSIIIDETLTAQELVENVLLNNSGCATVSGFFANGGSFPTGFSYAKFEYSGTDFPFSEGIVLSTGKASNTQGPSGNFSDDTASGWNTDPDLDAIFGNTTNATVLEFDFTPATDFISFEYLFASEEYQEGDDSTCQYSDVFAFLIKPIGGSYTNIAVIPGTNIPIKVTTVHPEIPNGCPAENEEFFGSFNNSSYQPISFDGMTTVLKAESAVVANTQYHIKLVIADHSNARYDSAVFLKADSFNVGSDLGEDRLITTGNALCDNETLPLDAITANSYQWFKLNITTQIFDPLASETNQRLLVTSASATPTLGSGTYKVEANLGFGCVAEGQITVEYDNSTTVPPSDLIVCFDTISSVSFNFNDIISIDTTLLTIESYHEDLPNAQAEIRPIPNITNYPFTMQDETITARIINNAGCISFTEITLKAFKNPELKPDETIFYCINDFPGKITLESGIENPIGNETVKWFNSTGLIQDSSVVLLTDLEINQIGNYTVTVTSIDGCEVSRTMTVESTSKAVLERVVITENEFYKKVSAIIGVSGLGNYQYALDIADLTDTDNDIYYQNSNIFENLSYGVHTLYVRDTNINNCETLIHNFVLLDFPKFFTPNNDSINDYWNIDSTNLDPLLISNTLESQINTTSDITIFDRIGRLVATINPKGLGWNGKFKGEPLPDSDYWFRVELIDFTGKTYTKKGHFSLQK